MAQSLYTMFSNAKANLANYETAQLQLFKLEDKFYAEYDNKTCDEKIAFYDKHDSLCKEMKAEQRKAYKVLEQIAGLFGNTLDPEIKKDWYKIACELDTYKNMVKFMFGQAFQIGYKVNDNSLYE